MGRAYESRALWERAGIGIRNGLKIRRPKGIVGSSPTAPTMNNNKYPGHGRRPNCIGITPFMQKQIDEDTCEEHGVFCCPECFDMRPIDEEE